MLFPLQTALTRSSEATAFVVLRWQELFDSATPDTFQPRLLNLPSLVKELEAVATLALQSSAWDKHLTELQLELRTTIDAHKPLLIRFQEYSWQLEHLTTVA